jgi:hypothetical protein
VISPTLCRVCAARIPSSESKRLKIRHLIASRVGTTPQTVTGNLTWNANKNWGTDGTDPKF